MAKIKEVANAMERGKISRDDVKKQLESELDMEPTREVSKHKSATVFKKSTPAKQNTELAYRPDRVKSSIPPVATIPSKKKSWRKPAAAEPMSEVKNTLQTSSGKKLNRREALEHEETVTQRVLEKMRDNPNARLHEMHTEVSMLNRKIEPILARVEHASDMVNRMGHHKTLSSHPGPVGMLSKMGGRLISFYADDLA